MNDTEATRARPRTTRWIPTLASADRARLWAGLNRAAGKAALAPATATHDDLPPDPVDGGSQS